MEVGKELDIYECNRLKVSPLIASTILDFEVFDAISDDIVRVQIFRAVAKSLKKTLNSCGEEFCSSLGLSLAELNSFFDSVLTSPDEVLHEFFAVWFQIARAPDLKNRERLNEILLNLDDLHAHVTADNSAYLDNFLEVIHKFIKTEYVNPLSIQKVDIQILSDANIEVEKLEEAYRMYVAPNLSFTPNFLFNRGKICQHMGHTVGVPYTFLNLKFLRLLRHLPQRDTSVFLARYFKFLTSSLHPDQYYRVENTTDDSSFRQEMLEAFNYVSKKYKETSHCREDQILSTLNQLETEVVTFSSRGKILEQIDETRKRLREEEDFFRSTNAFRELVYAMSLLISHYSLKQGQQRAVGKRGNFYTEASSNNPAALDQQVFRYLDSIRTIVHLIPLTEVVARNASLLSALQGLTLDTNADQVARLVTEAETITLSFDTSGKIFYGLNAHSTENSKIDWFPFGQIIGFCPVETATFVLKSQKEGSKNLSSLISNESFNATDGTLTLVDVPPDLLKYVCGQISNLRGFGKKKILTYPSRLPCALIVSPLLRYGFGLLNLRYFNADSPFVPSEVHQNRLQHIKMTLIQEFGLGHEDQMVESLGGLKLRFSKQELILSSSDGEFNLDRKTCNDRILSYIEYLDTSKKLDQLFSPEGLEFTLYLIGDKVINRRGFNHRYESPQVVITRVLGQEVQITWNKSPNVDLQINLDRYGEKPMTYSFPKRSSGKPSYNLRILLSMARELERLFPSEVEEVLTFS